MLAFVRAVSPNLAACELTHLARTTIDANVAAAQHAAYRAALAAAGCIVLDLPPLPDAPDAVFVEDVAVLLGRHAIITRPGAASRAAETPSVAATLGRHFTLHRLPAGHLEGGDVLRIGQALYVGQTTRTDAAGTMALRELVAPLGFTVHPVAVTLCLHLKTGVTFLGPDARGRPTLLLNPDWIDADFAAGLSDVPVVRVHQAEPWAANTVWLGTRLLVAAGSPRTQDGLGRLGFDLHPLDISELQKAEAGVTCMSLIEVKEGVLF